MTRTLLVTGGSKGIGAATAILAANRGYDVAVNYRGAADQATAVAAAVRAQGRRAIAIQADVADEAAVTAMFEAVDDQLGPLDALVCSAGINEGQPRRVAETTGDEFMQMLAVNVAGTMLCCREAVRRMSTASDGTGGAIVNVSSMAVTIGGRDGRSVYAASKAAVDVFTKGLAKEVATEGIRVNTIRPGVTLTPMNQALTDDPTARDQVAQTIAMHRVADADEIAAPILWLLSEGASFISGANLDAAGGGFLIKP